MKNRNDSFLSSDIKYPIFFFNKKTLYPSELRKEDIWERNLKLNF